MIPFLLDIQLGGAGYLKKADTQRQTRTAQEILRRLDTQPGLILADEVGMGKTFVALAVAVSVAIAKKRLGPVVIMTPSSLKEKWPSDWEKFKEKCLPTAMAAQLPHASAEGAVDFLRLLSADQPPRIIFLTHGAMIRALRDPWVKLALLRRALIKKPDAPRIKRVLASCAADLLQVKSKRYDEALWRQLLEQPVSRWADITGHEQCVPDAILEVLDAGDVATLYPALRKLNKGHRHSNDELNQALTTTLKKAWPAILRKVGQEQHLPLLILDEAHHLKNDHTKLAGLFADAEAEEDAGILAGAFDRMLFLTATPFQLGHGELCSILDRFAGVRWPRIMDAQSYVQQRKELRAALDEAHQASRAFDRAWGSLRQGQDWKTDPEVHRTLAAVRKGMASAQLLLRPWVIRHQRPPMMLPRVPRRLRLPGASLLHPACDLPPANETGIEVADAHVLPFLLAARATIAQGEQAPVFAEGLASSYEAFRRTRASKSDSDREETESYTSEANRTALFYLRELDRLLTTELPMHPKIAATVQRAMTLWRSGEKVVIFCHYRATGHALSQAVSAAIHQEIAKLHGWEKLGRWSDRMRQPALRAACDAAVSALLKPHRHLRSHEGGLQQIVRRFLRTPGLLSRHVPKGMATLSATTLPQVFAHADGSGLSLEKKITQFFEFLSERCTTTDRETIIDCLRKINTGERDSLLPNVSRANGETDSTTRQRIMKAFNSPFYPEVLVASSVMSEGVDLHLFCRHAIHHDLSWNPSSLEQRTGRVDRLGCKAEHAKLPIHVYLPYVAATQDEKQFRVVMDREKWFGVLMGGGYDPAEITAAKAEALAERVALPEHLAEELSLKLAL